MKMSLLYWLAICGFVVSLVDSVLTASVQIDKSVERVKRQYTTLYDDFDVDEVLQSSRLMKSYIKCVLDKGPCTREGRELKDTLPDALQTDCSKCSVVQKRQGGKVLSVVLQDYRDDWDQLVAKYDPEGIFRKKYGYDGVGSDDGEEDEGDEA